MSSQDYLHIIFRVRLGSTYSCHYIILKTVFFSIKVCDGLVFRVRACRSEAKSALQQIHARR